VSKDEFERNESFVKANDVEIERRDIKGSKRRSKEKRGRLG
jgi:hypothetical protein